MPITIDAEFRALIPPLAEDERAQLEQNIRADGCRDPLVLWNGVLIDGHNRFEICQTHGWAFKTVAQSFPTREDVKIWIIRNQFGRRNLQPFQRGELALILKPLIAEKAKARQIASGGAVPSKLTEPPIDTRREIAKAAGLSDGTIAKVSVITEKAPESVKEQLRKGEISIDRAYQDIRGHERRAERVERIQETVANNAPLDTADPVPVIYADPPWRYEHAKTDNRAIENQYPTMTHEGICALPVSDAATSDAVLFLWATSPKLAEAMRVVEAWGFTYRTSMVWVKDQIGMGYYARQRHELLLIATRGDLPVPEPANRPDSVVTAPRGEHSAKPDVFYAMIERMYPEFAKRELFLRGPARKGWTGWGNQSV
jgi:N6-adenosine-specific RNA methylase IME4/ParB-like chromosome segregation protein Spo0J